MNDAAAIAGSYSDFKLIKSRSVAQVIIELPIERAEAFLKAFGVPQPGAEKPVALALLNTEQPKPEKPRQRFEQMSLSQQAGLLCADERFQLWLGVKSEPSAAIHVREMVDVKSRADIDASPHASRKWMDLVSRYRIATGQQAEVRG